MKSSSPELVEPPSEALVTTSEIKAHLPIDFSDDDDLLDALVAAATNHFDGYSGTLGRCLVSQSWHIGIAGWPTVPILLPFPDVSAVAVAYLDVDGENQSVAGADFELIEGARGTTLRFRDGFARPALSNDAGLPVSLTMTAGYGDASDVPHAIKVAVMMLTAHWYRRRTPVSDASEMPFGISALVAPFRRVGL